jgi:hypothetical protein
MLGWLAVVAPRAPRRHVRFGADTTGISAFGGGLDRRRYLWIGIKPELGGMPAATTSAWIVDDLGHRSGNGGLLQPASQALRILLGQDALANGRRQRDASNPKHGQDVVAEEVDTRGPAGRGVELELGHDGRGEPAARIQRKGLTNASGCCSLSFYFFFRARALRARSCQKTKCLIRQARNSSGPGAWP